MVMVVASFYVGLIALAGVAILEVYKRWKNDPKNMKISDSEPTPSIAE